MQTRRIAIVRRGAGEMCNIAIVRVGRVAL